MDKENADYAGEGWVRPFTVQVTQPFGREGKITQMDLDEGVRIT